jgi:CubicO group peptidase (beta-lactamase class C family)
LRLTLLLYSAIPTTFRSTTVIGKMRFVQTLLIVLVAPIAVSAACYNPGPSFPPVDRILDAKHLEQLRSKLDSAIPDILTSPDGWTADTTSFALQVTSANEKLWDYYHTAPILGEYKDSEPTPVTGDTAFRIASISKSFTVYAVLLEHKINLDDSVRKYIPELLELQPDDVGGWYPEWNQITIRSLASQLSGITRDGRLMVYLSVVSTDKTVIGGLLDLAVDTDRLLDPVSQGFPPAEERYFAPCLKNFTDRVCNGPGNFTPYAPAL